MRSACCWSHCRKNFLYDIWGDAVNVASRMYSSGAKGRIQTTEEMNKKLETEFALESRGIINVKGKGLCTPIGFETKG